MEFALNDSEVRLTVAPWRLRLLRRLAGVAKLGTTKTKGRRDL